jgi:hypothetical protein
MHWREWRGYLMLYLGDEAEQEQQQPVDDLSGQDDFANLPMPKTPRLSPQQIADLLPGGRRGV